MKEKMSIMYLHIIISACKHNYTKSDERAIIFIWIDIYTFIYL